MMLDLYTMCRRTLKRPPVFLKLVHLGKEGCQGKRRHTIGGVRGVRGERWTVEGRAVLLERAQREIAEEYAEEGEGGMECERVEGSLERETGPDIERGRVEEEERAKKSTSYLSPADKVY